MKITVIGASGKAGTLIMAEATNRGHTVTAVVRSKSALTDPAAKTIEKDLFALTYADVEDSDVIIDAFGAWTPETLPLHQTSLQYLCDLLSNKPNRLLLVGGAGSLYTDDSHTTRVMDAPDFTDV